MNLLPYGITVADSFARFWEEVSGRTFDPWSEIVSIVGLLDGLQAGPDRRTRSAVEEALVRAVNQIG
jgi:hypothetical protein